MQTVEVHNCLQDVKLTLVQHISNYTILSSNWALQRYVVELFEKIKNKIRVNLSEV